MKDRNFTFPPYVVRIVRLSQDHVIVAAYDPACTKTRPGNGGTRWMQYESAEAAEREARFLAERMAVKHSIYKTGFLGATIVVCGPRNSATRSQVLNALAELLNQMNGILYTGCDLNTCNDDMNYLSRLTPYVMNSLSNPGIDTAKAAGSGVFAAARTTIYNPLHKVAPKIALHGLGRVGSQVAFDAWQSGYTICGYDLEPDKDVHEAVQSVTEEQLLATPSDVLVFCSLSDVLTPAMATAVQTKWIVSAANAPLQDPDVIKILDSRGISYLPDTLANSGAVLCDSLEWNVPNLYQSLSQEQINRYIHRRVAGRTSEAISLAELETEPNVPLTRALQATWEKASNDYGSSLGGKKPEAYDSSTEGSPKRFVIG